MAVNPSFSQELFINLIKHDVDPADAKKLLSKLEKRDGGDDDLYRLRKTFDMYKRPQDIVVGDIVCWKNGMKNRSMPSYWQPAVVVDKLAVPIFDDTQSAGSQFFHEPLDLRLGFIDDDGSFIMFYYDSHRFVRYEDSSLQFENLYSALTCKESGDNEEPKDSD